MNQLLKLSRKLIVVFNPVRSLTQPYMYVYGQNTVSLLLQTVVTSLVGFITPLRAK